MNIYSTPLYPFLAGEMLPEQGITMTIHRVKMESIVSERGTDEKPVIYFSERPKGFVLNKTNASIIVASLGPETDNWIGAGIHLVPKAMTVAKKARIAIRVAGVTKPAARKEERAKATHGTSPTAKVNDDLF